MIEAPLFRIWLDDAATIFCLVDEIDHAWALQWKWGYTLDRTKSKYYATRNTRLHGRAGPQTKIYMHKAILERVEPQPSELHKIGDHRDSNSLDNRRHNLRWATVVQNRRNRHGLAAMQAMLRM